MAAGFVVFAAGGQITLPRAPPARWASGGRVAALFARLETQ
jgi:hypothetical protein